MRTQSVPQGLERTLLDPIKTAGQLATLPKSCMSLWTHLPPSALSLNDAHLCVREEALAFLNHFVQACFGLISA